MVEFIVWIALIVGFIALAYVRARPRNWLIISAVLMMLVTGFSPSYVMIVFWLVWLALLWIAALSSWRQKYLIQPILKWYRKVAPTISEVEREVIDAGGTWWEAECFSGNPDWEKLLHDKNQAELTVEEQAYLAGPVDTLCSMIDDWEISQRKDLPKKIWDFIKQERFWALTIPKKYGGLGFSALAHSAIITKISSCSNSVAITVMVPNSLGPATFLQHFATEEQKDYYLPRMARAEEIGCFALTSPEAGSDATSLIDRGVVCRQTYNGKEVLGIRVNFNKRYITLAPVATLIGMSFKVYDPDHLVGDKENIGITCAFMSNDMPGVEIGERHQPMTMSFMNGPIVGRDVFIPMDMVVGGEAGLGRGWFMMMDCLSVGRGISLPSLAAAANQLCFRTTSAYATIRHQFKHSIADFEGVAQALANIGGYTYLAEATRIFTAMGVDSGVKPAIASAIAKYQLTELARKSVNHAMDIHGGRGIQSGPRNYLAGLYDSIPVSITVEGANILTRNLIIFGQGLVRSHPYVEQEMLVAGMPAGQEQLGKFDQLLLKHIGFSLSHAVRTTLYGLTGGRFIPACRQGELRYFLTQLTRISSAFIFLVDVSLLVLGGKLKVKESLSARFGDIVSYFYMASAVIRRYEQAGEPSDELPFMHWSVTYCLAKIGQAFTDILQNFPNRFLAVVIKRMIFPLGQPYQMPSDKGSLQLAKLMCKPSLLRDKLTQYCYIGTAPHPVALVEDVFLQSADAEALLQTIPHTHAKADPILLQQLQQLYKDGQMSQEDYDTLASFLKARIDAIQVDEFNNKREVNEPENNSRSGKEQA